MIKHYAPDSTYLNGFLQKGRRSLFKVLLSSSVSINYTADNVLNPDDTYCHTKYEGEDEDLNTWFLIDLTDHFFYIENYSISTRAAHFEIERFPKSWSFQCSYNNQTWANIDTQTDAGFTNISQIKLFNVEVPCICKYFRFTNFKTADDEKSIVFRTLDIFGYFIHHSVFYNLSRYKTYNININVFLFVLFYKSY